MNRRTPVIILGIIAGIAVFFWWMSNTPAPIAPVVQSPDLLAKSATKGSEGWSRVSYDASSMKSFTTYQEGKFLMYGQGTLPTIIFADTVKIDFTGKGQWILRSMDPGMKIEVTSDTWTGTMAGIGSAYFDLDKKTVSNFDANMVDTKKVTLLPSFSLVEGKKTFFDLDEEKSTSINPDLWSLYAVFLPRDTARVLGTVTKKDLDTMIKALIEREPESSSGIFTRDLRARNGLDEISQILTKIDADEPCGVDMESCYTALDEVMAKNEPVFPEVFTPLKNAINAWLQTNTDVSLGSSWRDIFHAYHDNILAGETRSRSIRDRAILAMIRTGKTNSYYEIWQYLTQMLAREKSGSVYSMQIMTEMIRIGESLRKSEEISDEIKSELAETAITSLTNLRNILEDAYFTKKDYYFILRSDLVDTQGKVIQVDTLIKDLQLLITEIDHSALLQLENHSDDSRKNLAIVRGQLAWFNCIFSRNDEYVANPRVCRVTLAE